MCWLEFLEGLVRLAHCKPIPCRERVESTGNKHVDEYFDHLESIPMSFAEHKAKVPLACDEEDSDPDPFAYRLDEFIRLCFRNLKKNGLVFRELMPPKNIH